ncbi:hypothetical protein DPMN_003376 [Dreissena polymorpha]|uniref:Uncharacterized protein n=1 Tax=Dreissena polymorpha TaxID=45954 RepID=A0A9D4MN41_DREPO|nr:hypothetical protein DPMN_003376 [Dreissena polymorpha]
MRGIKQAKILLNAEQISLLLLVASLLHYFSSGRSHFSLKFEPRLSPGETVTIVPLRILSDCDNYTSR